MPAEPNAQQPPDPHPFGRQRDTPETQYISPAPAATDISKPLHTGASAEDPAGRDDLPDDTSDASPDTSLPVTRMRFGIRSVFGLTAMCAVQFALISYTGPLIGLLIGIGICMLVIAGVMVAAFAGSHNADLMDRLDRLAIQLTVAITLLLVAMVVAGGGHIAVTQYAAFSHAWQLQREMGFTAETRHVIDDGVGKRAIIITGLLAGGEFEQAGFQPDDAVLPDELPPGEFYDFIEDNRGKEITINVATGGANRLIENCTTRSITFTPPN